LVFFSNSVKRKTWGAGDKKEQKGNVTEGKRKSRFRKKKRKKLFQGTRSKTAAAERGKFLEGRMGEMIR